MAAPGPYIAIGAAQYQWQAQERNGGLGLDPQALSRAVRSRKGNMGQFIRATALEMRALHDHVAWWSGQYFVDATEEELVLRHAAVWGVDQRPAIKAIRTVTIEGVPGAVLPAGIEIAASKETDPRNARELLADFERVLGPDPCGRDLGAITFEDRRRLAHQRWTARGGQSIPYMIEIAANLGVEITIDEFWPGKTGNLRCGHRLRPHGIQYHWRINVSGLVTVRKFQAGTSTSGHRLGSFLISDIECELRRLKPAHTTLVFSYTGA